MFKSTDAATPEEYIDRLEEPRRADVLAVHELIRRVAPDLDARIESGLTELIRAGAAFSPTKG